MTTFGHLKVNSQETISRRELHAAAGGQQQSGISPSSRYPLVFLFTNPSTGEAHGYFDGENPDGYYHYSGEGQSGDQVMWRGNKRIRDHASDGRTLHLFEGAGKGLVTYKGEYEYVDHYETDEAENGSPLYRKVFMFRLRRTDGASGQHTVDPVSVTRLEIPRETTVEDVPTEAHETERYFMGNAGEPSESERREAALVKAYELHSRQGGRRMLRKRINVAGEVKPLFCDLWDPTSALLIEAKGSTSREAVRMAVGQLLDYRRFIEPRPELAVLLPERPRRDLVAYLQSVDVAIIYKEGDDFRTIGADEAIA